MKKIFLILVLLYIASYVWFRSSYNTAHESNQKKYIIFPKNKVLYYLYRPLEYLDARLTGAQFHIGPHQ